MSEEKNFKEDTLRPILEIASIAIVCIIAGVITTLFLNSFFWGALVGGVIYFQTDYHKKGGDLLMHFLYRNEPKNTDTDDSEQS